MFSNPKKVVDALGISPGMVVADVGSGPGEYVMQLAQHVGHGGLVYAIDVQKDLLSRVKKAAIEEDMENIEVIWGDVEKEGGAGLSDNTADVSLVANALFQFEDKKGAVQEIIRITKPTGKIVIIDWKDSFGGLGPQMDAVVGPEKAIELLEGFGFKKISDISAGDHHYGIIFQKEL